MHAYKTLFIVSSMHNQTAWNIVNLKFEYQELMCIITVKTLILDTVK